MHFELIPMWLWAVLVLIGLAFVGLRWRAHRARLARRERTAARHRRNLAHARAWNWVFGRRKTLRIADQRDTRTD